MSDGEDTGRDEEEGEEDETARIHELITGTAATIGYKAHLTNSDWGRAFADELYATGDGPAIRYVMADGAEGYRSKFLSEVRARARRASGRLMQDGISGENARACIAEQLSFEICAPGTPPIALRYATHELIAEAYHADLKQLQGRLHNSAQMKRAMDLTRPYPGRTVEKLIAEGLIDPRDLAVEAAA